MAPDNTLGRTLRSAVANVERQLADMHRHLERGYPADFDEAVWRPHLEGEIARLNAELAERQDAVALWDSMTAAERRSIGVMPTRAAWNARKRAEAVMQKRAA